MDQVCIGKVPHDAIRRPPCTQSKPFETSKLERQSLTKGHLILKCFFVSSLSSKKRMKTSRQVVKSNLFVDFFEEMLA